MKIVQQEVKNGVAHITLDRPEALNALNQELIEQLIHTLQANDLNADIGCMVIYGSDKAFVAGVDIKAMLPKTFSDHQLEDVFVFAINEIQNIKTPIIAAVSGYALGGGCELAMACDIIVASETAKFGQPEIKLATIPGLGGTQRLSRAIGKAKTMDLVLTARNMHAEEAERCGLVARVVRADALRGEVTGMAETIASYSRPVVRMAKKAVRTADETTLSQGLESERQLFEATFALDDRKEGMQAFVEKRAPKWSNR